MRKLADRLEFAGKWASLVSVLFVALTMSNPSGPMLALTILIIAPAYTMPAIADWLRTKSVLEAIRSHERAVADHAAVQPGACNPVASAEHSKDWPKPPME